MESPSKLSSTETASFLTQNKKALKKERRRKKLKDIAQSWELYIFLLPAFLYFVIFHYIPLYGLLIAFKDYVPTLGVWGSPWVGFEWFTQFFHSYYFWDLIRNTIEISLYSLVVGFPLPIILALAFNEIKDGFFKRGVQTVTYAPHFISLVVMVGMIIAFLSPQTGIINDFLGLFGIGPIAFMSEPGWFKTIFVFSDVWQGMGWGSIIYMAALSGIDPQLHEAATVDGASRWQRIWHINIPTLVPTMVILFILDMGGLLSVGFQKILLMQNDLNMDTSDVISTFVYRTGILDTQYSYSTAVGLFDAVINAALLVIVNQIARKRSQTSLW
ncbi:putative aldouronate transport system permease protein [Pullulanibacillus pueri]|uniref:Sugar ABC transporter permease n=1 Tax=Pullulanibacillus pueri TaxID=1437324 RepID=A0A8J2ZUY3_9BACL|nr:ABC transporter permease subunit [Pullulanibacillus pueri]MBM7681652.1 putative aldouronate transport system permease protein [Pullulanibacillus pueri]GGH79302.1 sugar ABC transporter permease [Pullulanibacillus pueri]